MSKVQASTIINMCKKYVGTKESPANSNNVIFNTHYYGKPVSGSAYPWCCVFLWDIFRLCGASELFYGGKKCAYTPTLYNYYKAHKQAHSTPKVGDLVFYKFPGSSRINHVGIVIEVLSKTKIKTIEGNTSGSSDANGGEVEIRTRATTYVYGYGRPSYAASSVSSKSSSSKASSSKSSDKSDDKYTRTDFIKDVQKLEKTSVDGIAGPKTLRATVTLSKKVNPKHALVKPVQKYLKSLGYDIDVDGVFGDKTDKAIKKFQSWMPRPDGEITKMGKTWKVLLGLAK